MINQEQQDNEEKATLDDDINTFSAALIYLAIFLSRAVFVFNIKNN